MNKYRQKLLKKIGIPINENDLPSITWTQISKDRKLSEEFIREFQDKLSWTNITIFQNLTDKFLIEFDQKINWVAYFSTHNSSYSIMKQYILKCDFTYTSEFIFYHLKAAEKKEIEKLIHFKNIFKS